MKRLVLFAATAMLLVSLAPTASANVTKTKYGDQWYGPGKECHFVYTGSNCTWTVQADRDLKVSASGAWAITPYRFNRPPAPNRQVVDMGWAVRATAQPACTAADASIIRGYRLISEEVIEVQISVNPNAEPNRHCAISRVWVEFG